MIHYCSTLDLLDEHFVFGVDIKEVILIHKFQALPSPGMHCVHLGLVQWANASTIHLLNDHNVFSGLAALVCCNCAYVQIGFSSPIDQ